ncbi:HK97 family phage prohead protease [Priestia taiwanensis]|uniref:Peptidase U35 n=1 Tax=Priestia taiwanensis TaxID=1347902 RepID=A0A917AL81_9BACI|nr:HK97 family phage prohead protease [Priestia taiwanensis]MBM7361990.1 HK97 family phage prohead protease [Priestia taiwanensis]GGE58591.1 peptidase U35 [Priestia taiwanensis]
MKVEIRGNQILIDGYVNAVDRESRVLPSPRGYFKEKIIPKAFEKALSDSKNVDLLFNHKKDRNLGSIGNGNLELYEDNIGLRASATVTDEEVIQKARNGELRGWSFAFISKKDNWSDGQDGIQLRSIEELELLEVSILDQTPAYVGTSIEARGENTSLVEHRSHDEKVRVLEDKLDIEKRSAIVNKINEILGDK